MALGEVLAALEARPNLGLTHFGWDERKRVAFSRSDACAQLGTNKSKLFLWHRGMETDPAMIELGAENPLWAQFSFVFGEQTLSVSKVIPDYLAIISALRPVSGSLIPIFDWNAATALYPETVAQLRTTYCPRAPAYVQRLGVGQMGHGTYLDEALAASIGQDVLAELGCIREGDGYIAGIPTEKSMNDLGEVLRFRARSQLVMKAHGIAGRMGQTLHDPSYFGPNWSAPRLWTRRTGVIDRRIVGPNV